MEGILVKPNFSMGESATNLIYIQNDGESVREKSLGQKHCIRKCICITRANATHDNEIVLETPKED